MNGKKGTYKGLGEVALIALLLNENDLKSGNLVLDFYNNKMIKFDGDKCFRRLRRNEPQTHLDITENMIKTLPFPNGYFPYNWLGIVRKGVIQPIPDLNKDIAFDPRFRTEVNQALLKVLLLPDDLIERFISSYTTKKYEKGILDEFMHRRNLMQQAAFQNQSFMDYLASEEAFEQANCYVNYLAAFKTTGKNFIFASAHQARNEIMGKFDSEMQLVA